jgi:hypothetical protein
MNPSIQKLQAILRWLDNFDLAQMEKDTIEALRNEVTQDFVEATAGLSELLLGEHIHESHWLWKAEKAEAFGGEWIATYSLLDTGDIESAIGESEKVRMAAAIFPSMEMTVDIFAAYHHPGGTGMQVDPRITISFVVMGDPELDFVEHSLSLTKKLWPELGKGVSLEVRPRENCCDEISNPKNLHKAYSTVARAARKVAKKEYGGTELTEGIEMVYQFDSSSDHESMTNTFEFVGRMFAIVAKSLKNPAK